MDFPPVVECPSVNSRVKYVSFSRCCRFKCVRCLFPAQHSLHGFSFQFWAHRERVHGKRLHGIACPVSVAQVFEYPFIYCAAYGKSE